MRKLMLTVLGMLALTGGALAQLSWPVRGAIGQTWTVTLQNYGTWTLALSQVSSSGNGAIIGRAAGPDTRTGYFEYVTQNDLGILWLDISSTDSYGCLFERSGLQGSVIRGKSIRDNNNQLEDLKSACTASVQTGSAPTPPAPPQPAPSQPAPPLPAPSSALTWPVALGVGQNYVTTVQGTGSWNVALTAPSSAGFSGTATPTQGGAALQASFFNRPDVDSAELDLTDGTQLYSCLFTGRASLQNGALVGVTYYRATATGQFQNLNRPCEVRPSVQGGSLQPPAPQPNPQPSPTPPTPPASASWPPKPGQTWVLNISGLAPWTVNYTNLDGDGDPEGTAVQSGRSSKTFAFATEAGSKVFQLSAPDGVYVCVFSANPTINGASFVGGQALFKASNAQEYANANKSCTATLQASTGGSTQPPSSLSWPINFAIGQTWSAQFQAGSWTATLTQKNANGLASGRTVSGPDARGVGAVILENGSAAFILTSTTQLLFCVATRSGLQGNTVSGQAELFSPPEAQQSSPAGPCSFTLQTQTLSAAQNLELLLQSAVHLARVGVSRL